MDVRKRNTIAGLLTLVGLALAAPAVQAEEQLEFYRIRYVTVPDAINTEFFRASKDIFGYASLLEQTTRLFWDYPENQILRDSHRVARLHQEIMLQQTSSDPLIRTLDTDNPFRTSIRLSPELGGTRILGSELVFEQIPLR
ncbi:hypothetical protein [Trichothermofontia sp.]